METVSHALELIRENIPVFSKYMEVPVSQCVNRILAEAVVAPRNFPVSDNSSMDGYVFLRNDIEAGKKIFPIQYEIKPEHTKIPLLKQGFCARILTGGMVPHQEVIIIPVEQATLNKNEICVNEIPAKDFIRKKGSGFKKGEPLLAQKTLIRPYEKGLLISAGIKRVKVLKELRLCIQNTGNEINADNNTNGPVLEGLLNKIPGLNVKVLPVAGDNKHKLKKRFKALLSNYDIIVSTGGISAGNYDYVHSTFEDLSVRFFIRKISQKPGKPLSIGIYKNRLVCCLPGNPMSAVFCTELYLRVLLYKMLGIPFTFTTAFAQNVVENNSLLTAFYTGCLYVEEGMMKVKINPEIQSNLLTSYRDSNCYIRVEGGGAVKCTDKVEVVPFI